MDVHQDASPALSTWGPGIVYSRLLRFKSGRDLPLPNMEVECELCLRWEMVDDTTYVFFLRDDVRWHNLPPVNGRPLVADDLVFSYERQRRPGWANAGLLQSVSSIEALGPHKLRIRLSSPDADFLRNLADGHSKIVAREAVEAAGDLRAGPPIGTGPWVWSRDQVPGSYTFDRNPSYFEPGLPYAGKLRIHVIPDEEARAAAFATGIIDVIDMGPQEWASFHERHPQAQRIMVKEPGVGLELAMNTTAPPFDSLNVRRAAFLALDPWKDISDVWLGSAFVSLGLSPVEADWLLTPEELGPYFGDPAQAQELLRGAGVNLPVPLTVRVGDFGERYLAHAQRVVDELRSVGFEPSLDVVTRRAFGEEVWAGGRYQMYMGPIAPISTPNGYLLSVLHSRGRFNTPGYRDSALDALIEQQAVQNEPSKRRELVREAQRRALEGAFRFMPATGVSTWTWSARVRNFHPNFAGHEYSHWSRVWLEDGR